MKALVTGGGGFVGQAIVRQLLARGDQVAVLGRGRYPALEQLGVRVFRGDIREPEFLVRTSAGFDTLFHVAAKAGIWGRRREYEEINILGTDNVIRACLANRIKTLVYTSTPSVVFAGNHIRGSDESLPLAQRFLCDYARTKAVAEQRVLGVDPADLKTCALRPHLVWGPGDPHLVPRLLDRGRRGLLRRVGDGCNLVDISYVENVAQAHLLAADNLRSIATAAGRAYFISQGEPVNLWDWIKQLFCRAGIPPVEQQISFRAAYWAGALLEVYSRLLGRREEPRMTRFLAGQLAKSHWFSIRRASEDLGYVPRISTSEGMDRLIDWLGQQGVIKK